MKFSKPLMCAALVASAVLASCGEDESSSNHAANSLNATNNVNATNNGGDPDMAPDMEMPEVGTAMRFDPASDDYFDRPFPSDSRLLEDGTYGMRNWPKLNTINVPKLWLDGADDLKTGWGLTSAVFAWFDAPLDATSLPADLDASIATDGGYPSVFLMNVDPDSPTRGELMPIECKYTDAEGTYHPANQLACMSPYGTTRERNTRYALVFTRDVRDAEGEGLVPSPAFAAMMRGESQGGLDAAPYKETADYLTSLGIDNVASFALFTTFDPTQRLMKVYEFYASLPEPTFNREGAPKVVADYDDYVLLEARYDLPLIQQGPLPYSTPPAGNIVVDDAGDIVRQGTESVKVFITVPKQPMPEGGFPLMIYMHGSGGSATELMNRSPLSNQTGMRVAGAGPAENIATYGIAGFSADFALHDSRYPPDPDTTGLKLYNLFENPRAMIDNFMIGANEVGMHSRLMANITIDPAIHDELDAGDASDGMIRFDTDRFAALGQSMGSMLGTPAMTIPNEIDAFVNAGSGGTLIEIGLTTRDPIYLKPLLKNMLRYPADEELDRFDPVLNALQHLFAWMDPYVHARHMIYDRHEGAPVRHLFHPSGLDDRYFSPAGRAGLTTAFRVPLAGEVLEEEAFDYMKWRGLTDTLSYPVQGNLQDGAVTGFVRQFAPAYEGGGHYVVFDKPEAQAQYACFIKSLNADAPPVLLSPEESTVDNCP